MLELGMKRLEDQFRSLDLEMTDALDKLTGIAKRFSGRKGGRPPNEEPEQKPEVPFNRHVG
jgi:hypothetical protein